jgi:hypothetical protein
MQVIGLRERSVNLSPDGNTLAIGSLGGIGNSMIVLDT